MIQVTGGSYIDHPHNNTTTQGGYDVDGGGDMFISLD